MFAEEGNTSEIHLIQVVTKGPFRISATTRSAPRLLGPPPPPHPAVPAAYDWY